MAHVIIGNAEQSGQERSSCGHAVNGEISPLRQRLYRDMDLAGLSQTTQEAYVSMVVAIQKHYGINPARLSEKQVYEYILWLRDEKEAARGTFQSHFHGLKFFYYRCLGYDWDLFTKKKYGSPGKSVSPRHFPRKTAAA